ncbi:hypothetical protein [Streptomyces sp. NPDC101393]|uniref:hypothetical protein n=1 Tax=Streptomyces sp. NPDC101393 TaxID=3366141 RepID=UPI003830687C
MPSTSEWWVYDGTLGAPRASEVWGSCSCGWRGSSRYEIDWDEVVAEGRPVELGLCGPREDWEEHITEVDQRAVPLPGGLTDLLEQLDRQLYTLADQAPLAALRAVGVLERAARRIGLEAAYNVGADEISPDAVEEALGLPEQTVRSRLTRFRLGR